jgi:ABC-2 type transport system permease protein
MTAATATVTERPGKIRSTSAAVWVIWKREIIRWWRDKTRIIGSLAFPLIFLVVFGSGLSGAMGSLAGAAANIDFQTFIFPGIIAMSVFFSAIFNGVSLVFDREFGILKEVLVAPISRSAVALGKSLGGATVATFQGTLVFLFAPLVGVSLTVPMVLAMWPVMFAGAFAMSSLGVAMASRMRRTESFQVINQFVTFPLIFLSGAFFPLQALPAWMEVFVKLNPVTYAVDALRQIVFQAQGLSQQTLDMLGQLGLGIQIGGHTMTVWNDVMVVVAFGLVMNVVALYLVSLRD